MVKGDEKGEQGADSDALDINVLDIETRRGKAGKGTFYCPHDFVLIRDLSGQAGRQRNEQVRKCTQSHTIRGREYRIHPTPPATLVAESTISQTGNICNLRLGTMSGDKIKKG